MGEQENPLEVVRRKAGGAGGRAYVAAVGKWLAQIGFHPSGFGKPLRKLLGSMPGFCEVVGDFVVFGSDPPPELEYRPVAPGGEQPLRYGPTREQVDGRPRTFLVPTLWNAMINDRDQIRWYVDLETLAIIEAPWVNEVVGPPVSEEPERYVAIPTIKSNFQQEHARAVLEQLVGKEMASNLTSGTPWWPEFRRTAEPNLQSAVLAARTEWVMRHAQEWIKKQGLPAERLLMRSRPSTPRGEETADTRRRLHAVVDRLTERELARLEELAKLLLAPVSASEPT